MNNKTKNNNTLTCPGCGITFCAIRKTQTYHNRECGVRHKRKIRKENTAIRRNAYRLFHYPYIDGDVIRIRLTGKFEGKEAIIDNTPKNWDIVRENIFGCDHHGYPMTTIDGSIAHLHHLVFGKPSGKKVVDHINGNKLDNRFCNLREISRGKNNFNQPRRCHNSTGITGVYYEPNPKKGKPYYYARIYKNNKAYNLGHYANKNEAIKARLHAEIELYGEYSDKSNSSSGEKQWGV